MSDKEDFYHVAQAVVIEALANTHTILVAKVMQVNTSTIDCKPVMNRVVDSKNLELTVFPDVPVVFLHGGTSYTAHPIAKGDYCLLLVSERCFDSWYAGSDFVKPLDARMFDYSDAFAIVGVTPLQAAISIPKVITQIGDTYQQGDYVHDGDRTQTGDYVHTGNLTRTGTREQTGDDLVDGNATVTGTMAVGNLTGLSGGAVTSDVNFSTTQNVDAASYSVGGQAGATGSGTNITVVNGLVVSIS